MKIKNNAGFSLAEMLMAILILLLVSGIVAAGVPVAKEAYERVVIGANAKVLLSTAISTLRDEIATARNVKVENDSIEYFSADKGATCKIYIGNDPHQVDSIQVDSILVDDYIDPEYSDLHDKAGYDKLKEHSLISQMTATGDLYLKYDTVTATDNKVSIGNLGVYRKSNPATPMALVDNLEIRIIKPVSTETP